MDIKEFLSGDRFAARTGIELLEAADGYARARMEIGPEHLNAGGVCQGGAIFTLADLAFAAAVNSRGQLTVSIDSNIHFFRSVKNGFLYAEARELFDHKRISHCEVKITDDEGRLVAALCGTGYRKGIEWQNRTTEPVDE